MIVCEEKESPKESAGEKGVIRRYRASDREAVRRLCCETGFLGKAIDPVFEDREIFADYLTSYYTDWEPEASFVVESDGMVKGYLLGSRRPRLQAVYNFLHNGVLFCKGMWRYRGYREETREYIRWILKDSWKEVPEAPKGIPHFHFNLLPEVQGLVNVKPLLQMYLEFLREKGEKRVYGQVVTFETRRGAKIFERFGFRTVSKKEITKYRKLHPEPVYLTTVIKELDDNIRI